MAGFGVDRVEQNGILIIDKPLEMCMINAILTLYRHR